MHAICPVKDFKPEAWVGWTIVSTERIEARAGVPGHMSDHRALKWTPVRVSSTGFSWDVHHLTRPRNT